jgi:uncharacterized protein (DUF885 family)
VTEVLEACPADRDQAATELARLCDDYFTLAYTLDPFTATEHGVRGFDALVPDPSRDGAGRGARQVAALQRRLRAVNLQHLDDAGQISAAVLGYLARSARARLEYGLWEANTSAAVFASPAAMMFRSVPAAALRDVGDVDGYARRLRRLAPFLDAVTTRYQQAAGDGRDPTRVGIEYALRQLDRYLATEIAADPLVTLPLPAAVDAAATRARLGGIAAGQVRPAVARLMDGLRGLLPISRPDDQVGLRFVPGGDEAYLAEVARHTSTALTPPQIHQLGLDTLAAISEEWAELGSQVLGVTGLPGVLARLRDDPALRFQDSGEIVRTVTAAQDRAEAARDQWFPRYDIPGCVTEEIDPLEARNATRSYYRPPAAGGGRPGAHRVLTACPTQRPAYEYEALSFHDTTPGHHLQIASAQTQPLPAFRRYVDIGLGGYVEGWADYSERLADEMGLYSSGLQRLGLLATDALNAGRAVADTGMHYYGWSRARAVDFLRRSTVVSPAVAAREIDQCIGRPGQALAHLTGRLEIQRLRGAAERALGSAFDIRAFHGIVLGNGAVPLEVLDQLVGQWTRQVAGGAA